jgi:hypothetical protein
MTRQYGRGTNRTPPRSPLAPDATTSAPAAAAVSDKAAAANVVLIASWRYRNRSLYVGVGGLATNLSPTQRAAGVFISDRQAPASRHMCITRAGPATDGAIKAATNERARGGKFGAFLTGAT